VNKKRPGKVNIFYYKDQKPILTLLTH
jgi:hypothetical protein